MGRSSKEKGGLVRTREKEKTEYIRAVSEARMDGNHPGERPRLRWKPLS